ncbi:MAG: proton-conducting transporter membrane subunit [Clostridia bacterium]
MFSAVLLTSILAMICLVNQPQDEFVIISLTSSIKLVFKLDGLGMVFAGLISILWPFATLYAFEYMEHYKKNKNMFFAFYTMTFGVTMGVAFSANCLTMYVFYEFLTLVTTPLVLYSQTREAVKASRKYLYYSITGAAIGFVAIISVISVASTNFSFGGIIPHAALRKEFYQFAYILAFVGFGVKSAIYPMHGWLPSASVAPTPVTALLHAVAVVKAGAFVIMRMTYYVFGADLLLDSYAQVTVTIIAGFTVLYASIMATKEQHFKRRLAYSTISNLSYILLGVVMMSSFGLLGALCHMVFHAFMKITAFFCAGAVMERSEARYINQLEGLGKKMPFVFTCFAIATLSLCGLPPLIGFTSKYMLINAGIENGTWLGYMQIAILIIAAVLAVIYLLFVAIKAFYPRKDATILEASDPGILMKLPIGILTVAIVVLGIYSQPILEFLTMVANGQI